MPPTTDPQPIDAARPDVPSATDDHGFQAYADDLRRGQARHPGRADRRTTYRRRSRRIVRRAPQCPVSPATRPRQRWPFQGGPPDGRFELTSLGDCLRADANGSLRGLAILYGEEWYYRTWAALLHSVRTGQSAFEHVHGLSLFDYLNQHPEAGTAFNDAMTSYSAQETAAILDAYNFSEITHVVDVGGGHGRLLAAILRAYPEMRGTLFDQSAVVDGGRRVLGAAGVSERCEISDGDFFSSVPSGGDAYLLKSIIHDWDDAKSISILRRCRAAMSSTGRLLLFERVVPTADVFSEAKLFDINMLVVLDGLERTEAEYAALLAAAGFA